MKKRKLKTWVKVSMLVIAMLIVIIIDYKITNDAVKKCVKLGFDEKVCIEKL